MALNALKNRPNRKPARLGGGLENGSDGAAGVAVDGALFVAGRAVLFLLCDGFEIGGVVLGRHLHLIEEKLRESGMAVEDVGALSVGVDEIECGISARAELCVDALDELFEHRRLEWVEEEDEDRRGGELELECVLLDYLYRRDGARCWVGFMGTNPVCRILAGDSDELRVEFHADDLAKAVLAGHQNPAAFAGPDIDKGIAGHWVRRNRLAPAIDEGAQYAWCDSVVGGHVLVVGMAGKEMTRGNEAAGVDAVHLVERMNRQRGGFQHVARPRLRCGGDGRDARIICGFLPGPFGFGRGHLDADWMLTQD